jgi:hypothetical protein
LKKRNRAAALFLFKLSVSPLSWGNSLELFEGSPKGGKAVKADRIGNFGYAHFFHFEKIACQLNTLTLEVILEIDSDDLLEKSAEVGP